MAPRPLGDPQTSQRPHPHIRLNSATSDLSIGDPSSQQRPPAQPRQSLPRLLTPARNQSFRSNAPSPINPFGDRARNTSSELLLAPPRRDRSDRYRDDPFRSPTDSAASSRRSSFDSPSTAHTDNPFVSPYGSRPASRAASEEGDVNTQTVSEKYTIRPNSELILFPEDVEKDDWLHNPVAGEKDGRDCNLFNKRSLVNVGALAILTIGILLVFILWPALTFVEGIVNPAGQSCATDPNCISGDMPLLKNIRRGPIDPDTPRSAYSRVASDGRVQSLVFSDEFNTDGRSFYGGDDPYFQAVDLWYGVTQDLEWYDPDAITTKDGVLQIRFDAFQNHGLNYRSGMLQSWNKLCFKGGYMEASISLPGAGNTIGFWPGFWAMGNLGRPGYASTTDGLWPYSYWDKCDYGITKNQSQIDGLSFLPGMRLPACPCEGEDHPSPGRSRSAPEIDALEASVGYLDPPAGAAIGSASQSAQFAPFDIWYQPNYDFVEVYDHSITTLNAYRGGFYQQAMSGVTNLNNDWYDGKAYQTYAFDYKPGIENAYTTWFVGEDRTWHLDARAVGPNGNIGQRVIPQEPLALVANLGMSNSFANLNFTGLGNHMPATMRFDYIRIYQSDDDTLTCDPPGYETTDYIASHPRSYLNKDKTLWAQTGYEWPKNTFVDECSPAADAAKP